MTDTVSMLLAILAGGAALLRLRPDLLKARTDQAAKDFELIVELRDRLNLLEKRSDEAEEAERQCRIECAHLEARVKALEERNALRYRSLTSVLEHLSEPAVLTAVNNGGCFKWVNRAFAEALGMPKELVLSTPWQDLVHPADLARTLKAEAAAWNEEVSPVNRYRKADGSYVEMRWHSTIYEDGEALALALIQ